MFHAIEIAIEKIEAMIYPAQTKQQDKTYN